jgi:hypothetical protein
MLLIRLVYDLVAIPCIIYAVFNYMEVLSWLWVKGKVFFVWLWNKIKEIKK